MTAIPNICLMFQLCTVINSCSNVFTLPRETFDEDARVTPSIKTSNTSSLHVFLLLENDPTISLWRGRLNSEGYV